MGCPDTVTELDHAVRPPRLSDTIWKSGFPTLQSRQAFSRASCQGVLGLDRELELDAEELEGMMIGRNGLPMKRAL